MLSDTSIVLLALVLAGGIIAFEVILLTYKINKVK